MAVFNSNFETIRQQVEGRLSLSALFQDSLETPLEEIPKLEAVKAPSEDELISINIAPPLKP